MRKVQNLKYIIISLPKLYAKFSYGHFFSKYVHVLLYIKGSDK